jgi:hypothetical protein
VPAVAYVVVLLPALRADGQRADFEHSDWRSVSSCRDLSQVVAATPPVTRVPDAGSTGSERIGTSAGTGAGVFQARLLMCVTWRVMYTNEPFPARVPRPIKVPAASREPWCISSCNDAFETASRRRALDRFQLAQKNAPVELAHRRTNAVAGEIKMFALFVGDIVDQAIYCRQSPEEGRFMAAGPSLARTCPIQTGWVKVMRLLLVNSDTNRDLTAEIGRIARDCAGHATEVVSVLAHAGPLSIECHADEMVAAPRPLDLLAGSDYRGFDVSVVACFPDEDQLVRRPRSITNTQRT